MPDLTFFRDDFRMSTWLIVGATIQILISATLPTRLAITPAIILLTSRMLMYVAQKTGYFGNTNFSNIHVGRFSTQIPQPDGSFGSKPSDQGVVVMVLAAQFNHIDGRFGPNVQRVGGVLREIWADAAQNKEKWGFLGRTSTMKTTHKDFNNTVCWISYWTDIDHLLAFAHGPAHRKGWDLFNKLTKEGGNHIGVMHELYQVPKKHWETVYHNFEPFGFGQTEHFAAEDEGAEKFVSPLRDIRGLGRTWDTSMGRMGRTDA